MMYNNLSRKKTVGKDNAMAEKDIAEKTLEAYNDVFADTINVLLFQGRQFVKEDEGDRR